MNPPTMYTQDNSPVATPAAVTKNRPPLGSYNRAQGRAGQATERNTCGVLFNPGSPADWPTVSPPQFLSRTNPPGTLHPDGTALRALRAPRQELTGAELAKNVGKGWPAGQPRSEVRSPP